MAQIISSLDSDIAPLRPSQGPATACRRPSRPGLHAKLLWIGLMSSPVFACVGCRTSEGRDIKNEVRQTEEALLVATRDKDWGRMFEFLPARVREHSVPYDLGVAVEASGQLLLSWELGEVQPMKVNDSYGRDVDGFGVHVKGAWRNLPGHTGQTSDQWTDFWFRADGRWVWTGRD